MAEPQRTQAENFEEEKERLAQWRSERMRVAAEERARRIAARQEADEIATDKNREKARALLPTASEIAETQAAIQTAQARQRGGFWAQFVAFVVAPVAACLFYLTAIATPLFEAKAVIAITKPGAATDANVSGLLGTLNAPTNLQEVFMAHEFVRSQAIMDGLESDLQLVSRLSGDAIDPVQRLREISGLPYSKHDQFSRFVDSSVDIQTGMISLFARAPSPEDAIAVSEAILARTEAHINLLNADLFDQRLAQAQQTVASAQAQLSEAQAGLVALQINSGEVNPRERVASIYGTIRQLEADALQLNNDLQKAEVSGRGETFLARQTAELETRLREQIAAQRQLLVSGVNQDGTSLNAVLMDYEMAELRVRVAEETVKGSLVALSEANKAAALGRSTFQVVVPPRTAQAATYPNTPSIMLVVLALFLTFFVFVRLVGSSRGSRVI